MSESTFNTDLDALVRGEAATFSDDLARFAADLYGEEQTVTMPQTLKLGIARDLGLATTEFSGHHSSPTSRRTARANGSPVRSSRPWTIALSVAAAILLALTGILRWGTPTGTDDNGFLMLSPAVPTAEATPAATPTEALASCSVGDEFVPNYRIDAAYPINLRPGPGIKSGDALLALQVDTPVMSLCEYELTTDPEVDDMESGQVWIKVRTEQGEEGWIREIDMRSLPNPATGTPTTSPVATPAEALASCSVGDEFVPNYRIDAAHPVNLRPGPGIKSGDALLALQVDTPVMSLCEYELTTDPEVDDMESGQVWIKVRTEQGEEGWIREIDLVDSSNPDSATPEIDEDSDGGATSPTLTPVLVTEIEPLEKSDPTPTSTTTAPVEDDRTGESSPTPTSPPDIEPLVPYPTSTFVSKRDNNQD